MRDYGLEQLLYNMLKDAKLHPRFVVGSGSVHSSEDIITKMVMIQCKDSMKDKYRIQYKDIDKLYENAKQLMKIPIFITRTVKNNRYSYLGYRVEKAKHKSSTSNKTVTVYKYYTLNNIGETLDDILGYIEKLNK